MLNQIRMALGAMAFGAISMASAQVDIDYEDSVSAVADGTTIATMDVTWTNDTSVGDGGIANLQMELTLPDDVTLADCVNGPAIGSAHNGISNCDSGTTGSTVTVAWADLNNRVLPSGVIARLDFTVASGTSFGIQPIGLTDLTNPVFNSMSDTAGDEIGIDPGTNFSAEGGSLDVQCPTNESCYQSNPSIDSDIDFTDSVLVGQSTAVQTIGVSNGQDDNSSTFNITGAGGTGPDVTVNGSIDTDFTDNTDFPATVPADGGSTVVGVDFQCVPGTRGNLSGTITIDNTADNPTGEQTYPFVCIGLSPEVDVPADFSMSGTVAGSDPTATLSILNINDNFAAELNGLNVAPGGPDGEITISPTAEQNMIAPGESVDYTVTCDSTNEDSFQQTFNFTWTQPDPNQPSSGSVTVTCNVSDTDPVYEADPAPDPDNTPDTTPEITFTTDFNTTETVGIDVVNGNPNPAADPLVIDETASGLSGTDSQDFEVSFPGPTTLDPEGTLPDGDANIEVSCTPPGVGTVEAVLTVVTNDPSVPNGEFIYDLECTGTGEQVSVTPDGLNLGTVPPGTQTPEGTVSFTNNGISGSGVVDVVCSVSDPAGVFTFTANPAPSATPDSFGFNIPEGESSSASFQCTPPDISSFTAEVSCDAFVTPSVGGDARGTGQQLNFEVTCSGRPLVIPTMSRWGLVVMSLMLLLVGGFATRRMMA